MTAYISLLRGINVGGSKILSMAALCDIYSSLGFSHVRTYLQSGNVLFASPQSDPSTLVRQVEARIQQVCGFHVDVFIRQPHDFELILANNPFLSLAGDQPARLHVSFLYRPPSAAAWGRLDIPTGIPDKFARGHTAIYLYYPNGSAKTKIPTSYLEKVLSVPLTDRNWNTVNSLYNLASELPTI